MSHIKKRMLINASHDEQSRVAIALNDYLQELDVESAHKALTKGNIYKGVITKVEPSLQAAFIEYGAARQGFLPLNEVHADCWKEGADKTADPRKINIKDVLDNRQELLIQVVKEERGNKGAALTTNISLAGRYTVLMPNNSRGGISRKLSEDERRAIKQVLAHLNVPENMGLIVRTAGKDQELESLQWDYQYLRRLWDEIRIKGESAPAPSLIYLEGDLATRAIRDHFTDDIDEIQVDNPEVYTRTKAFVHAVLPGKEKIVKLYRGKQPLFRKYAIESQCEEIHHREIRLRSGGSIVIDPTEALTSIDVNSSRATGGKNIDDTALATNLEAAAEVARQLRIRDIGGLVVIDFIDMANRKHGQKVEEVLRDATKTDKARIQFAKISRFGLMEMSRQRLHPSIRESTTETCPRCQGSGSIRTVESMALKMLTRMEDWAERGKKPTLNVQVPSVTGEYLMNNKRTHIARIEEIHNIQIALQIKPELMIPHYRIEREWKDNEQQRTEVLEDTSRGLKATVEKRKVSPLKPVVGIPMPQHPVQKKTSIVAWFMGLIEILTGQAAKKKRLEEERKEQQRQRKPRRPNNRNRQRNRNAKNTMLTEKQASTPKKVETPNTTVVEKKAEQTADNAPSTPTNEQESTQARRRRRRRRRPTAKREGLEGHDQNTEQAASDKPESSKPQPNKPESSKPVVAVEVEKDLGSEESRPAKKRPSRRNRSNKAKQAAKSAEAVEKNEQKKPESKDEKSVNPVAQEKPVTQKSKPQEKPKAQQPKQAEKKIEKKAEKKSEDVKKQTVAEQTVSQEAAPQKTATPQASPKPKTQDTSAGE
ncbi:MAG: Rne/Rng family ribonuclease [Mariprofundaceae bacterium]|nr:Rne/Rng family ribonuclease [Mariprofundaceae bacterium]